MNEGTESASSPYFFYFSSPAPPWLVFVHHGVILYVSLFSRSAPIKALTSKILRDAVELLRVKLEKLQQRIVDEFVERKCGSRLSPASPIYQKIAQVIISMLHTCPTGA